MTVTTRLRICSISYAELEDLASKERRTPSAQIEHMIETWGTDKIFTAHPNHHVANQSALNTPTKSTAPKFKMQPPGLDHAPYVPEPDQVVKAEAAALGAPEPWNFMYNPRPLPVGAPRFVELPRLREFEDHIGNKTNCAVKFLVRDDGFETYRPAALVCEPMVWPTDVDIVYDAPPRVPVVPHTIVDGGMPQYAWEQLKGLIDASVDDGTFDEKFPACSEKDIAARILASEWMPNHIMTVRPDHEMGERHIVD